MFKYELNQEVNCKVLNSVCIGSIVAKEFSIKLVKGESISSIQYSVYVSKIQGFLTKVDEAVLDKFNPSTEETRNLKLTLKSS